MPLTLPPLNALRAFEAAARTGSYVAAAEELGVSAAAISQQIRKLEDYLGKQMFTRMNNRVVLTDAGNAIREGTAAALQMISDSTEQLVSDRSRSRLMISTIDSVAEKWLVTRLASYCREHPEFRFELRVEPDPADFARHNIDLRIGYGPSQYPEHSIVLIEQDVVLPLCSPAYLERNPAAAKDGMAAVPEDDLLHTSWGESFGSHPTWHSWFVKAKLKPPLVTRGFQVGRSSLALDLALGGLGVALGQRMMAKDDISAGRLVALSDISIALGYPYCLAYPRAKGRKRHLVALATWLTDPAATGDGS
ncbi:MAG: LysR family transcriptional regulator [Rhodobacterales bacterium]|nr:LysR family transcriptional regulator [Rhodobacterales bacterium]